MNREEWEPNFKEEDKLMWETSCYASIPFPFIEAILGLQSHWFTWCMHMYNMGWLSIMHSISHAPGIFIPCRQGDGSLWLDSMVHASLSQVLPMSTQTGLRIQLDFTPFHCMRGFQSGDKVRVMVTDSLCCPCCLYTSLGLYHSGTVKSRAERALLASRFIQGISFLHYGFHHWNLWSLLASVSACFVLCWHQWIDDIYSAICRSVQMRLYALNKRQFVLVFVTFFICFGVTVLIGLAGKPLVHVQVSSSACVQFPNNLSIL